MICEYCILQSSNRVPATFVQIVQITIIVINNTYDVNAL